jgi:GT2 family glycosyltransferase
VNTVAVLIPVRGAVGHFLTLATELSKFCPKAAEIIVIDDRSSREDREVIAATCSALGFRYIRTPYRCWYPGAINLGAASSQSSILLALNSDTIPPRWLIRSVLARRDSLDGDIIGFISNAAGYQSVPWNPNGIGEYPVCDIPQGLDAREVSEIIASLPLSASINVPFINGFAFAIRRSVFEELNGFDTQEFPYGYGEEIDLCLRARSAGYSVAVDATTYIYHAKSQSYTKEQRDLLVKSAQAVLNRRWGAKNVAHLRQELRACPGLVAARIAVAAAIYQSER